MENSSFISAFRINGKVVYAKVDWIENETDLFHIQIYDSQDWWTGRFSNEFADRFRDRVGEETEEYRKNVKTSLMNTDEFEYDFATIAGDNATAQFIWKKTFKDSDKINKLLHGSVPVHKSSSSESSDTIIDFLLSENKKLRKVIDDYEMNIHMLNGELESSKSELEKFMNIKTSLEMSVYGKFINLLNSKKRKIQLLEQNLLKLDQSTFLNNQNEVD